MGNSCTKRFGGYCYDIITDDDHPGQGDHIINQALAILRADSGIFGNAFTQPKAAADFLRLKMGSTSGKCSAVMLPTINTDCSITRSCSSAPSMQAPFTPVRSKAALNRNAAGSSWPTTIPPVWPSRPMPTRITARSRRCWRWPTQVLDHFVVGQHDVVSFAERGLI